MSNRWTHKTIGDFTLKIDNQKHEWFLCPNDPDAWFIPPKSAYKFKLPWDEYTEVKVVLFSDGFTAMMPVTWTHKEPMEVVDEIVDEINDKLKEISRSVLSPKTLQ